MMHENIAIIFIHITCVNIDLESKAHGETKRLLCNYGGYFFPYRGVFIRTRNQ